MAKVLDNSCFSWQYKLVNHIGTISIIPDVNYLQIFLTALLAGIFAFIGLFINNRITESKKENKDKEDEVNQLKEKGILTAISESENRLLLAIQNVETGLKAEIVKSEKSVTSEISNSEHRLGGMITILSDRVSHLEGRNEVKV
jgi:hypothetical protein